VLNGPSCEVKFLALSFPSCLCVCFGCTREGFKNLTLATADLRDKRLVHQYAWSLQCTALKKVRLQHMYSTVKSLLLCSYLTNVLCYCLKGTKGRCLLRGTGSLLSLVDV